MDNKVIIMLIVFFITIFSLIATDNNKSNANNTALKNKECSALYLNNDNMIKYCINK